MMFMKMKHMESELYSSVPMGGIGSGRGVVQPDKSDAPAPPAGDTFETRNPSFGEDDNVTPGPKRDAPELNPLFATMQSSAAP